MRKKVDDRLKSLVSHTLNTNERAALVIVGDEARDQVPAIHYIMSKARISSRPSVLWLYQKTLPLSSHKRKRSKQLKKQASKGLKDQTKDDPLSEFMTSTKVRFCYYNESDKILGSTYGLVVLQDADIANPNDISKALETCEGGGLVIFLLSKLSLLDEISHIGEGAVAGSQEEEAGRFRRRMMTVIAQSNAVLGLDAELNVLPALGAASKRDFSAEGSSGGTGGGTKGKGASKKTLDGLVESLRGSYPSHELAALCRTVDQAETLMSLLGVAVAPPVAGGGGGGGNGSVAMVAAGRGRGKSAAIGLVAAAAVALPARASVTVFSSSPENVACFFQFVKKGLEKVNVHEHTGYSVTVDDNGFTTKVTLNQRTLRPSVKFLGVTDTASSVKGAVDAARSAGMTVVDEAAALPLPAVTQICSAATSAGGGGAPCIISSTNAGYEGSGRALSMKLAARLRKRFGNFLTELSMKTPIRYAQNDPLEALFMRVMCLEEGNSLGGGNAGEANAGETNAAGRNSSEPKHSSQVPPPNECNLHFISRETLFSGHALSERFLRRLMSLYFSSHYRSSPNDIKLMSDQPCHRILALLPHFEEKEMPNPLAVMQIAFEGRITKHAANVSLSQGIAPSGDLTPWTISQQFQDSSFPSLSGARIVRIAVRPDLQGLGYGTRAVDALVRYFEDAESLSCAGEEGKNANDEATRKTDEVDGTPQNGNTTSGGGTGERFEPEVSVTEEGKLPPLLIPLENREPELLAWMSTAFGVSREVLSFWHRNRFKPVYVRQTESSVTGETTALLIRELEGRGAARPAGWLRGFNADFKTRLVSNLAGAFKEMEAHIALTLLDPDLSKTDEAPEIKLSSLAHISGRKWDHRDLRRLKAYSNSLADRQLISDLLPSIAASFFCDESSIPLSFTQVAAFLVLGLQQRSVDDVSSCVGISPGQVLALFNKAVRKFHKAIVDDMDACESGHASKGRQLPQDGALAQPLDKELATDTEVGSMKIPKSGHVSIPTDKKERKKAKAESKGRKGKSQT